MSNWIFRATVALLITTLIVCLVGLCGCATSSPGYPKTLPCRGGCGRTVVVGSEAEYWSPYGKCSFCRDMGQPMGERADQ